MDGGKRIVTVRGHDGDSGGCDVNWDIAFVQQPSSIDSEMFLVNLNLLAKEYSSSVPNSERSLQGNANVFVHTILNPPIAIFAAQPNHSPEPLPYAAFPFVTPIFNSFPFISSPPPLIPSHKPSETPPRCPKRTPQTPPSLSLAPASLAPYPTAPRPPASHTLVHSLRPAFPRVSPPSFPGISDVICRLWLVAPHALWPLGTVARLLAWGARLPRRAWRRRRAHRCSRRSQWLGEWW